MVDDAEESASKNPKGGVLDDHSKPIVNVKKRRKIVMLDDEDDNENGKED